MVEEVCAGLSGFFVGHSDMDIAAREHGHMQGNDMGDAFCMMQADILGHVYDGVFVELAGVFICSHDDFHGGSPFFLDLFHGGYAVCFGQVQQSADGNDAVFGSQPEHGQGIGS